MTTYYLALKIIRKSSSIHYLFALLGDEKPELLNDVG